VDNFLKHVGGKILINVEEIEGHSQHLMARMSGTLALMVPHLDLMMALFETLDPCEESFRYLTHLACVCKAWQSSAIHTRFNRAWLQPLRKRCVAYLNKIDEARSHLDLDYFILGLREYFSFVDMQQRIIQKMIVPNGNTQEDAFAVVERFRQTDASTLVPLLADVGFHHLKNFVVFYTICKISGILCQQDDIDNSQQRTQICVKHDFLRLFLEGVVVHKDAINITQCEMIVAAVAKLRVLDMRVIDLCVYYMRCFPDSVKIAVQFSFFMMDKACDDSAEKYVFEKDILTLLIQIASKHITNMAISYSSCSVLAYFALKKEEALSCVANQHGMLLLSQVIERHTQLGIIKAYVRVLKAIARDPKSVDLLHAYDIIPRIMVRLNSGNIGHLVNDADGMTDFLTILSYCVCDRVLSHGSMVSKLIEHGIVDILHTTMLAHVDSQNYKVHSAVISLLRTMSLSYNLKALYFNDEFMKIIGTNFARCIGEESMVAPMLNIFATLIEKSEKGRWTDMVHQHLSNITYAMASHYDDVDVQEAGLKIIMLLAQKRACRSTPLNLECIDRILFPADRHKKQSIYTVRLQALTTLMHNTVFRAHMVLRGAVFIVLEILQDADAPELISLCLLFLVRLENGEHNSHTSFKVIRYMRSCDKQRNTQNITNAEAIISKSLERPGITENMRKMAGSIHNNKFQ
jgi:hypothetical protein